tara:strand:+ start:2240 stop:3694 length:1455 start_codon:yes stop_codon:yes gene_type:complete
MSKYLINLDGYLRESLSGSLKNFIGKVDFSLFCATQKDFKFLKNDFPNNQIYCWEDFIKNNLNIDNIDERILEIEKELKISFMQINYSLYNYSQFYYTTSLNPERKNYCDIKRTILNYLFFSKILENEKPNIILHEHAGGVGSEILQRLSEIKNIKYLLFYTKFFNNRFLLQDIKNNNYELFDKYYEKCNPNEKQLNAVNNIFQNLEENTSPLERTHIKNIKTKKYNRYFNLFKKIKDFYSSPLEENYIFFKYPPIEDLIFERFKSKIVEFYVENFISKSLLDIKKKNKNKKIITFFLQSEPELTIYKFGGKYFSDQKYIIKHLALNLPSNFILCVKEHVSQSLNSRYRNFQFFKDLKNLSNVRFIKSNEDPIKIIENSFAIANLSGSIGIEALIRNKPLILFGNVFYQNFTNIFKINKFEDLKNIIQKINNYNNYSSKKECLKFIYALRKSMFKGNIWNGPTMTRNNELFLNESLKKIFLIYK